MRILHVTPYYDWAWSYGGIPRVVTALSRGLVRTGQEVVVCTTDACSALERWHLRNEAPMVSDHAGLDVCVFRNVSNRLAYHQQLFVPLGLTSFLARNAGTFDVGHIHGHHHLLGVMAARFLRRAGVPYVVTPNGTAPRIERRRWRKWAFDFATGNRVLKDAARVAAVSEAERRDLVSLGVPMAQLVTLPNPIEMAEFASSIEREAFENPGGSCHEPLIVYLGKLTPRKRIDLLIRAMFLLRGTHARLVVAGNDLGMRRSLQRLVADLRLRSRVTFRGLLRERERLEILAAADVVVYPGSDEVFGLVALEAILSGSPVVASDDSGCGEIVREVGGGVAFRQGDVHSLAHRIKEVLEARPAWKERTATAQMIIKDRFGSDAVARRAVALYRAILQERRRP